MCFVTDNPLRDMHKADEDITCWKLVNVVDGEILSMFKKFEYTLDTLYEVTELGKLNTFPLLDSNITMYEICKGFHSWLRVPEPTCIHGDYYYKTPSGYCSAWQGLFAAKCIILKDSLYLKNVKGELVSNSIIITKLYDFIRRSKEAVQSKAT